MIEAESLPLLQIPVFMSRVGEGYTGLSPLLLGGYITRHTSLFLCYHPANGEWFMKQSKTVCAFSLCSTIKWSTTVS